MTKTLNQLIFLFFLGTTIPGSFAADPSPARRKASVEIGNHDHFAQWAELQAHHKLSGDDRCTKVDMGESMLGEFREPGKQDDLHVMQIKRCSGTRPPIASYWGLYRGKDFVAGDELKGLPFLKSMEYADFPKNSSGVENVLLKGFVKEHGKCTRYIVTLGWAGDKLTVLKLDNDGVEYEKIYKCF